MATNSNKLEASLQNNKEINSSIKMTFLKKKESRKAKKSYNLNSP